MLSNLLLASSLMELCFPYFTFWLLENFRVATVKRERTTPSPLKAVPTGRSAPLANAGIEAPAVITAEVIKPLSTIPMIVFNRFFFSPFACGPQFHQEKMPQFQLNFLVYMFVVLVVLKVLNLDKFWYHCRINSLFI